MNALPHLLYILQAVPIHVPTAFFRNYKSLCTKFLWGNRRPRISYQYLSIPKQKGGIGLPDLRNYYHACHLSRVLDWNIHDRYKDWVTLEASCTSSPLHLLPWNFPKHTQTELRSHSLIGPTTRCFYNICKSTYLSSTPGPLTSLRLNPDSPLECTAIS